jgi:hypothetical protein
MPPSIPPTSKREDWRTTEGMAQSWLPACHVRWKRYRRRLLVTTETDEKAMVAPAMIGLRTPRAAKGMAQAL